MRYSGTLYRALSPYWAYRPLSGDGAKQFGGRFNRPGRAALYLADSVETALNEVQQAGMFSPVTLVAVEADLEPLFDGCDAAALEKFGVGPADLAIRDWATRQADEGRAPTQALAERLIEAGFCGMVVPSFAPGAKPQARNTVLWRWGDALPHRLRLMDDQNRLRHPPAPPL
ncbi:RES domain-containing protein [Salipiger bermudensis]|uniref:RES family NAD+ phosphorylase n=1 Tax=Salipiger bermudensis TaxID=344736 RepID=UPI001C998083|nr:RES domain-containing protein [Salipiger bermudensis]MBY6005192.1 RES domain-containing protein [Salipiger bermudensis]